MSPQNVALRRARPLCVVLLSCVLLLGSSSLSWSATPEAAAGAAVGPSAGTDPAGVPSAGEPLDVVAGAAGVAPGQPDAGSVSPPTVDATGVATPVLTTADDPSAGVVSAAPPAAAAVAPGAQPAAAPVPGSPAGADPVAPEESGAVWCQAVSLAFSSVRPDGSVPVGALTVSGTLSPTAAGRTVAWTVSSGNRVVTTGTAPVGAAGAFSGSITLPAGPMSVSAALRFPGGTTDACPATVTSLLVSSPYTWASGAAGAGVADGSFAAWRGAPTPVAGTWADNNEAMLGLWQLRPGYEFGAWQGDLDIAVGSIGPGETWSAAAAGAYDARWRQSLTELARLWSGRPGQLYIRFAHEFNGNWYPWSVTGATVADFRTAWIRYRALQQEIFPSADLVFSPNSETNYWSDLDWRTAFPGAQYVDVMAVDYYNMWPFTGTAAEFTTTSLSYDRWGAPRGLQRHQEFAASVGLPFAVSEWGNNADYGDSPAYIEQMYAFFRAHAGRGPGQLLYDVYFNVVWDGNPFALFPTSNAPNAAETYRRVF